MRTKNADTAKSATPKKATPGRKATAKATPCPAVEAATPNPNEPHRGSAAKASQEMNNEASPSPVALPDSKPEESAAKDPKSSSDATRMMPETVDQTLVTLETKVVPRNKKVVRKVVKVVKKTSGKAKTSAASTLASAQTTKSEEAERGKVVGSTEEDVVGANDVDITKKEETTTKTLGGSLKNELATMDTESPGVANVADSVDKRKTIGEEEEPPVKSMKDDQSNVENFGESAKKKQTDIDLEVPSYEVVKSCNIEKISGAEKVEEVRSEMKVDTKNPCDEEPRIEIINMEEKSTAEFEREDAQPEQGDYGGEEAYEEYGDRVDFGDNGEDDFVEDDPEEPTEEAEALEEEHRELTAVAMERKSKKEYEIFVGGLDRDATEEDLKRVFEKIGEVVEVRLHMNLSTNKNKGYAFVKFASKDHAKWALAEMKNPVICGKRCGTAPSEDNDTLFLGNICNTWTKEAIRQKLKDYGVEGVENITLVPDVQHEGRSRGFAFLEFSSHADAMLAFKRLQKPDVVFGHPERTAKVAFAEPIHEPDPEIMAQVKTVFLDGLPPHWDEDSIREHLKDYGEILRIVLARNMSTAKRKDFGFVDFSTHDAAVTCIEGINNTGLIDETSKTRVKARLSNPLPKTQAVKGAMCGGFRIGRVGSGNFARFGRSFERGGHHFNESNFQRGRGFYQRGRGPSNRMGPNEYYYNDRHAASHGRPITGRVGGRGPFRGGYHPVSRGVTATGPSRSNFNRPWHPAPNRGYPHHVSSRRQPFSPEEAFDRPFTGRHIDDPYFYDDGAHGFKRPFYMTDHNPDYAEPSRHRPRLDYTEPSGSYRGTPYPDTYGPGSDPYPNDYYGPDYGAYSSYYGTDRPYRGGYYY